MEDEEIELRCTIELIGKPKEETEKAIKKIVDNIEESGKKLAVSSQTYGEPKLIQDDFYSVYCTFNIKSDLLSLFYFVIDYAPSSIELLTTKQVGVKAVDLQGLFNDLSGRMNEMDQKIKIYSGQAMLLANELEALKKGTQNPSK